MHPPDIGWICLFGGGQRGINLAMAKRVLCLLVSGFEEIETITPVDLLRRAGAEVVLASVTGELPVTGRSDIVVNADASLAEVVAESFDLLFIPGGPGVMQLRTDGRPADLARQFSAAGKPIGAICAAPTVLADAGLLEGKRFTAHFTVHEELKGALPDERVVQDGILITSRGAGTAVEFGLALVGVLFGEEKAKEVSTAIMF
jgi:4-methyl-5(b-hydroxyethyl)-thiazole monophosphate biosynthesis